VKSSASEHVILVEVLELTRPLEEFAAAVRAAARRLEAEGVEELVTLQSMLRRARPRWARSSPSPIAIGYWNTST
jgi:hypothetical protein